MTDFVGERTLRDLLRERVRRHPDKPLLVCEDKQGHISEFNYSEFLDAVHRAARGFASLGIGKGDAVVVHLDNCPEFLISWFGLGWLGAVMVPSNTASTAPEMSYMVNHSEAVAVIGSPGHMQVLNALRDNSPTVRHWILARTTEQAPGVQLLSELMDTDGPVPEPPLRSEDIVEMIFTSGTTSRPKGVLLTHANHLRSGERASRSIGLQSDDRCLTALPAFHVNAQSMSILASLTVGGTVILLEEYRASKFWSQLEVHRATATSLVAMQVRTMLAQPEREDEGYRLRRNFYAINVTDGEKEAFERRFHVELLNGYGLSETMTIVTVAPIYGDRRWPSIGLPAFDRLVRIVDENDVEVPAGEIGEIVVSGTPGRTVMKGYFRDPAATAAALRDGWLHTGDNGYVDEQGYVYFFDRKKDVIKRAGENVSASEVEFVLFEHPDIAEAAVIGVPDAIRDEAVKAYVVPVEGVELTAERVIAYCSERLARFKVPTIIEIRRSLPKTSIGKIEKKLLRAETTDGGGGQL